MAACQQCGADTPEGAFLGLCPACAKGRGSASGVAPKLAGGGGKKRLIVLLVILAWAIVNLLNMLLRRSAPRASNWTSYPPIETAQPPLASFSVLLPLLIIVVSVFVYWRWRKRP